MYVCTILGAFKKDGVQKQLTIGGAMATFGEWPVKTTRFVTVASTGASFMHLTIENPDLCAFEYCVCNSRSERIQGGYVDSEDMNSIVFCLEKNETYVVSLKIATKEKSSKKSGLALIKELFGSSDRNGVFRRRVYSPVCFVIHSSDYLKETTQEASTTEASEMPAEDERDEICSISGVNLSALSLKQRRQYKAYMSGFRRATAAEIAAATKIQSIRRGCLVRRKVERQQRAARRIQKAYRIHRLTTRESDSEYDIV